MAKWQHQSPLNLILFSILLASRTSSPLCLYSWARLIRSRRRSTAACWPHTLWIQRIFLWYHPISAIGASASVTHTTIGRMDPYTNASSTWISRAWTSLRPWVLRRSPITCANIIIRYAVVIRLASCLAPSKPCRIRALRTWALNFSSMRKAASAWTWRILVLVTPPVP